MDEAGLTLTVDLAPVEVMGARSLLAQAVANLLDNAAKFTPSGGSVTVVTAMVAGQVQLTVSDTGPGIPAPDHDAVLGRFRRLERDAAAPGSGIGLSIVAVAARVHGATLTLADAGPGLSVTLAFPAAGNG
jgi:signal transduction histidine kinase